MACTLLFGILRHGHRRRIDSLAASVEGPREDDMVRLLRFAMLAGTIGCVVWIVRELLRFNTQFESLQILYAHGKYGPFPWEPFLKDLALHCIGLPGAALFLYRFALNRIIWWYLGRPIRRSPVTLRQPETAPSAPWRVKEEEFQDYLPYQLELSRNTRETVDWQRVIREADELYPVKAILLTRSISAPGPRNGNDRRANPRHNHHPDVQPGRHDPDTTPCPFDPANITFPWRNDWGRSSDPPR